MVSSIALPDVTLSAWPSSEPYHHRDPYCWVVAFPGTQPLIRHSVTWLCMQVDTLLTLCSAALIPAYVCRV
jgi:hypothetical protein